MGERTDVVHSEECSDPNPFSIRNYMSKEWFLNFALRSERSPLLCGSDRGGKL